MTGPSRFDVAGDLPRASLALEASAGTGKTWTLTSLAVRYVAEGGIDLPDLLLVTFTRAATAELRERVRLRLAETIRAADQALGEKSWTTDDPVLDQVVGAALRADDDGQELRARRRRLRTAAQQLDEATISTIHGFCQRMLQHAALEAGVDFDAVLLDDDADLLAEIVDDHLARELRAASPAWVRYLQDVGGVSRGSLTTLARRVSGLPALHLQPDLSGIDGPCWQPWLNAWEQFRRAWEDGGRDQAIGLITQMKASGAFPQERQTTFTASSAQKKAAEVDAWLAVDRPLPPGPVDRTHLHRIPYYPMSYFTASALETKLPEGDDAPHLDMLDASARLIDAALVPATLFRYRAAAWIWQELDRRKRQRTVLTYDDLLRRLADALGDPSTRHSVRSAIRQRYRVALIDEFQDTDPVQWRIFSSLFDTHEPFVLIGDPKQAIYAFRGADVHTYVAARDSRPDTQTLQRNHRSDQSYVDACNVLFDTDDAFGTPDIPYHRIDPRHPDRLVDPDGGAALQVRFVRRTQDNTPKKEPIAGLATKGWANTVLPADVASVAVDLLERGIRIVEVPGGSDRADGRPLAPRDLAVLVRTNRRATAVQRALRDAGVPAVIQRGGSVFVTEEAEALQRLLDAMLRPNAERSAVTAAATLLFGRDAATLVAQRVDAHPDWDRWVDALTRWGQRWRASGILPALRDAFADEQVPERLLATPEGDRRMTNLRHLAELLHTAAVTDRLTPNALAEWLAARRAEAAAGDQPGTETELRLEEDAQAVRVVTIHGSKGLQYPVVLCPDLWDGRVPPDTDLTRFHDPDVGDALDAITLDVDVNPASSGRQRAADLKRHQDRIEGLRLAYVALTRAQHRSIVWWGAFNDGPTSALASLFHGSADIEAADGAASRGDRLERAQARVIAVDDDALIDDVQRLADRSAGAISVEEIDPPGHGATWAGGAAEVPLLDTRTFGRDVDRQWQRASFSSLVRDAGDTHGGPAGGEVGDGAGGVADPARDVDAHAEDAATDVPARSSGAGRGPEVPLARFPRGAGPGSFLHDVLEVLDLTAMDDDATLDDVLRTTERRHGIDPSLRPTVVKGLRAAVATPMGDVAGGARLADLGMRDRLNELWFDLPLAGGHAADRSAFSLAAVADLLAGSGDPLLEAYAARLRDPKLRGDVRGYLVGSIDLLARLPNGRFLVADYKSNWLGDRASGRSVVEHYRPDATATSLLDSHYVLQALLYLVATHRYLRWRLPDYDYDTHVAGAAYLFLRGMVGPDTPELDGHRYGVATIRPTGDLVEGLSRLLDGSGP